MRPLHILIALLVVISWGAHAAVIKFGLAEVEPFTLATWRYIGTALCLLPFAKFERRHFKGILLFALFMNGLHFPFVFLAIHELNASSFIVIMQLLVPLSAIWGWVRYGERFGLWQGAGIAIALVGLLIVFGAPVVTPLGLFLSAVAIVGVVLGFAELKKLGDVNLFALMGVSALVGIPFVGAGMLLTEPAWWHLTANANWVNLSSVLLYQIIAMSAAMMAWQRLLALNPMGKVVPFSLLQPVSGVLVAWLWLGEPLGPYILGGGALVVAGVSIITLRKARKARDPGTPPALD